MMRRTVRVMALLAGIAAAALQAQTPLTLDLQGSAAPLAYRGSVVKNSGWTAGGYAALQIGLRNRIEGSFVNTQIRYVDESTLDQADLTTSYTHYGNRMKVRGGAHIILNNNADTDGTWTVFAGLGPYRPYLWYSEIAVYLTRYPDVDPAAGGVLPADFTVLQIAPQIGWNVGDVSRDRYLYTEVVGAFIHLSGALPALGLSETDFLSVEVNSQFYSGPWVVSAHVWAGEQTFAVRSKGFSVFNLAEKHTGGYGISLKRVFAGRVALTAGMFNEQFRDLGLPEEVSLTTVQASVGITI